MKVKQIITLNEEEIRHLEYGNRMGFHTLSVPPAKVNQVETTINDPHRTIKAFWSFTDQEGNRMIAIWLDQMGTKRILCMYSIGLEEQLKQICKD